MRTKPLYGLFLLFLALSCSKRDAAGDGEAQELRLQVSALPQEASALTRAPQDAALGLSAATGTALYACFSDGFNLDATLCHVTGSGSPQELTPVERPFFKSAATEGTVRMYYPYTTMGAGRRMTHYAASFSVQADQSTEEGYRLSDLMYGLAEVNRDSPSATVQLRHQMAKIVVRATAGAGAGDITGVSLVSGSRGIGFTLTDGFNYNGDDEYLNFDGTSLTEPNTLPDAAVPSPLRMLNYGGEFSALLPPQTLLKDLNFICVATTKGDACYCLPADRTLESGHSYTVTLNAVSRAQLGATTVVEDWTGTDISTEVGQVRENLDFNLGHAHFRMNFVKGGCMEDLYGDGGTTETGYDVLLSDFYIAETEATQALWEAVTGSVPASQSKTGDDYPVGMVSWDDLMTASTGFIDKLNAALAGSLPDGWSFALPTSAQWEYAARGGKYGGGTKYAGSATLGEVAWYEGNAGSSSHPVAQKKPNELGLYDMAGNVWEWCRDRKRKSDYTGADVSVTDDGLVTVVNPGAYTDPLFFEGATTGAVFRGGSFFEPDSDTAYTESYKRICSDGASGRRNNYLGFRLALVRN